MNGSPPPKVLLMQLSERTSARGTRYMSGFLGRARLVAFLDQEPDKFGNPVWSVYASEPAPRGDRTVAGPRSGFFDADDARSCSLARKANNARSCSLTREDRG